MAAYTPPTLAYKKRRALADHRKRGMRALLSDVHTANGHQGSTDPLFRYVYAYSQRAPFWAYPKDWAQFYEYFKAGLLQRAQTRNKLITSQVNRMLRSHRLDYKKV